MVRKRRLLVRSLVSVLLLVAATAAVPPGGCAIFSDECGCAGDLSKSVTSDGHYYPITEVTCTSRSHVIVDLERVEVTGQSDELEYCSKDVAAGGTTLCGARDPESTTLLDYYEALVIVERDSDGCVGAVAIYNGK